MMEFVNFHHHTTFSFGDGFGTPAQHVARAAELGYTHIAATEHGNVSSHFQLEKAAKKAGITPLFGVEAYCGSVLEENDERRLYLDPDGEPQLRPARGQFKHHLTVIAKDLRGYRNLNWIVSQSWRDYYYHPTVSGDSLWGHGDGLVVLSGCSGSLLACTLLGGKGTPDKSRPDFAAARDIILRFADRWGDDYYLEIQPFYELDRTRAINTAYERLSRDTGVPLVVTNDVHYMSMDDAEMQAILHAVHRGKASVDDAMREWNYAVPLTLPESDEALYDRLLRTGLSARAAHDAISITPKIAGECQVTLPKAERLVYPISQDDLEPWV
jgi:DNA polymerase-3 subunit alpha